MTNVKIQTQHYERTAYVYVRQSTPWQVIENRESTERQYHLQERAVQLGWPASHVEVIDEDQGRSGSTATHRTGFQRLVTEVGLGKVGIVLMLEASRLARNNSDWYRLIEICGLTSTLIGDEGAVYSPREPNDRLLLGVKGLFRKQNCLLCARGCTKVVGTRPAREACSSSCLQVTYAMQLEIGILIQTFRCENGWLACSALFVVMG